TAGGQRSGARDRFHHRRLCRRPAGTHSIGGGGTGESRWRRTVGAPRPAGREPGGSDGPPPRPAPPAARLADETAAQPGRSPAGAGPTPGPFGNPPAAGHTPPVGPAPVIPRQPRHGPLGRQPRQGTGPGTGAARQPRPAPAGRP